MSNDVQLVILIFEGLAILIAILGVFFQIKQYNDIKKMELKQQRFENYNLIIDRLIDQRIEGHPSLDIQMSVFFEFRNYPEYKEVSKNILEDWKGKFKDDKKNKYVNINKIIDWGEPLQLDTLYTNIT